MKCIHCPAFRSEGYEYPEYYCAIYPEEECHVFKDGDIGCYHKLSTINETLEKLNELLAHQYDGIDEWYKQDQEIEQAITDAVLSACSVENLTLACVDCEGKLHAASMSKAVPSNLVDFVSRLRSHLGSSGYGVQPMVDKTSIDRLKSQIKQYKQTQISALDGKCGNRDYTVGYISALSAMEGMIAEIFGE